MPSSTEQGSTNPGLRIGVAGIAGSWSTEALADALAARTGTRIVFDLSQVACDLDTGRVRANGVTLDGLDAVIVKKVAADMSPTVLDRLEMLRFVEAMGVPVFSPPDAMIRMVDRLACTVTLRKAGIPMPPTVVTADLAEAVDAVRGFGRAVLKPLYSTKARGMLVIEDGTGPDVEQALRDYQRDNPVMYIQKMIALPGQDLGLVFLGGKYLATYARVSAGNAWNTTIRAGGRYAPYEPSPAIIEIAERAQAAFGLSFTSVDLVESDDGPMVFEVSAFGGFSGLRDGLGIDGAQAYADYVIGQIAT